MGDPNGTERERPINASGIAYWQERGAHRLLRQSPHVGMVAQCGTTLAAPKGPRREFASAAKYVPYDEGALSGHMARFTHDHDSLG